MASGSIEKDMQYIAKAYYDANGDAQTLESSSDDNTAFLLEFSVHNSKSVTTNANSNKRILFKDFYNNLFDTEDKTFYYRQPYILHIPVISGFNTGVGKNGSNAICYITASQANGYNFASGYTIGWRSMSSSNVTSTARITVTLIPPYLVDDDGST